MAEVRGKTEVFRAMHRGPQILLLPNAWDVASARVIQQAGFGAIATTSAGVAFSLGYPDGQRISRKEMLEAFAASQPRSRFRLPPTSRRDTAIGPKMLPAPRRRSWPPARSE